MLWEWRLSDVADIPRLPSSAADTLGSLGECCFAIVRQRRNGTLPQTRLLVSHLDFFFNCAIFVLASVFLHGNEGMCF